MRSANRLFKLLQLVRGRRLSTAAYLAQRLEVSVRTVYRDIAQLQYQGVPLEGEAGVGYRLGKGYDLAPLMFTQTEANALLASIRLAQAWLDPTLALAAQDSLSKVLSVLPKNTRQTTENLPLFLAPMELVSLSGHTLQNLELLREAVQARRKVVMHYQDLKESSSQRTIRPLGCFFWGKVWTLAAWCELRGDFRSFRVDRIVELTVSSDFIPVDGGKTLSDFLAHAQAQQ